MSLAFQFLPRQVNEIFSSLSHNRVTDTEFEVHLGFCLDCRSGELEDRYPANLAVKVNDKACALPASIPAKAPGGATVRVSLPVNIVSYCLVRPDVKNELSLSWQREWGREYVVGVFLVWKQSAAVLLRELQQRNAPSTATTTEMIKKNMQEPPSGGGDIVVTSFHVSLTRPLSKKRIIVPCRAQKCKHIQCFDAWSYLQVNETRPTWMCPVCSQRASFSSLFVDQLFKEVVEKAPVDCDSVVFLKDGTWRLSASPEGDILAGKASSSTSGSSKEPSSSSSNELDRLPSKRRKTKFGDLIKVIDLTEHTGDKATGQGAGKASSSTAGSSKEPSSSSSNEHDRLPSKRRKTKFGDLTNVIDLTETPVTKRPDRPGSWRLSSTGARSYRPWPWCEYSPIPSSRLQ
ncbi:hypothetical protein MTO96_033046 [Rhipicephalus appendiculatus]